MSHYRTTPAVWTLAALLACTPLGFAAAQSGKPAAGAPSAPGQHSQQPSGAQQQGQGASTAQQPSGIPLAGSQFSTVLFATVAEVNKQHGTVTLQGSAGTPMEFDVPAQALTSLQRGDHVELTIDRMTAMSLQKAGDAAQTGTQSGQPAHPGAQSSGQQAPAAATAATVEGVNKQDHTVTLRTSGGKKAEMQVPQAMLSELQKGDSVQLSIRKSQQGQQSGASGSSQSQPQQGQQSGTSGSQQSQPQQSR